VNGDQESRGVTDLEKVWVETMSPEQRKRFDVIVLDVARPTKKNLI